MSGPQKQSNAMNPYIFYTARELKNKGLVHNLAMCRRPRATPLPSRSSSSSYVLPSKALVRRKSISLAPERSCSYSPVYTSRATCNGSRASTPLDKAMAARDSFDKCHDDYDYDEGGLMTMEDGSTIIVAPPGSVRFIGRTKSGNIITSDVKPRGQMTRASSAGELRAGSHNPRAEKDLGSPYSVKFDLYGYTMAMRLRGHLVHLCDVLELYVDFDRSSGNVFNPGTHQQFFDIIDTLITESDELYKPLADWAERCQEGQEWTTRRLTRAAYEVRRVWSHHYDWIMKTSNVRVEQVQGDKWQVRDQAWEDRREHCMKNVEKMLRVLMEGVEERYVDYEEIGVALNKKWMEDSKLGARDLAKRGWAWVVRSDC